MSTSNKINYWQFRLIGTEQRMIESDPLRKLFIRLCGTLGISSRIRSARIINVIQRLQLPYDAKLLDVGCGHAYSIFWLARHYPGYHLTGLEMDGELVRESIAITEKLNLQNVCFVHESALCITEEDYYDLIYSADVLEHIDDDVGVLQNIHRALRPGGRLVLHLPRRHQEQRRIFPIFTNHIIEDHVRDEYTVEEILEKLKQSNFEVDFLRYGYSMWGELAFETNNLFWNSPKLRTITAVSLHPISVWLAYMDIRHDHKDGNSLLILCHPQ